MFLSESSLLPSPDPPLAAEGGVPAGSPAPRSAKTRGGLGSVRDQQVVSKTLVVTAEALGS